MRLIIILFFSCFLFGSIKAQKDKYLTPFEKEENTTATYEEAINFYKKLAKEYNQLQVNEIGMTDSGKPLHEVVISLDEDFDPASLKEKGKLVLMVNNAIHPGESCGVDASMMLVRDYLKNKKKRRQLNNVVLVVIPIYNIGGALNRNSTTRTNQNGPDSYGFRGNAKNLDLNRDFIKCDSRNARTFNQLFTKWNPDVFIDNHTSNGADYQYTITLIATEHSKMDPSLATYMNEQLLPRLYKDMAEQEWEMTPYVYSNGTPDNGIAGFMDSPRYSSGYASLFNCISFIPETHMLKPYKDRVKSTYAFMDVMIDAMDADRLAMQAAREKAVKNTRYKFDFPLSWELDESKTEQVTFKGYEAAYKKSEVTGLDRLYYDKNKPYTKQIPYYNHYKASRTINRPMAYIIPQAYQGIADRLRWNGVEVQILGEDVEMDVQLYRIKDFKTTDYAYEGHYLHSQVEVDTIKKISWPFFEGDFVVFTNQPSNRYIVETLEPQGVDSYFAWNFFDGILMQKEHFSAYVFEDLAAEYLKNDPDLKAKLEAKKLTDSDFAKNGRAQLDFIYKNTDHYERTHRVYPVARFIYDYRIPIKE